MTNRTAYMRAQWLHQMREAMVAANEAVAIEVRRINANPTKRGSGEIRSDIQKDYDEDSESHGGPGR